MNNSLFRIFKLTFKTPVHFGLGQLESSSYALQADSLFSAMYLESIKLGEHVKELLECMFFDNDSRISSLMPYYYKEYYLPKPFVTIEDKGISIDGDRKLMKDLKYLNQQDFYDYINGRYVYKAQKQVCRSIIDTKVAITQKNTNPYFIKSYKFLPHCGLYFIFKYHTDTDLNTLRMILESLQFTGLGGKRSVGYGIFSFVDFDINESFKRLLSLERKSRFITLAPCLPRKEELTQSLIDDSNYLLDKRSGYSFSSDSLRIHKKKDSFLFAAGSSFSKTFVGDIYNVSRNHNQIVYKYAKPLFIGI